jgi:hypothetical protein
MTFDQRNNQKTKTFAPRFTRIMALWLIAAIGFTLSQAFNYTKPADLLAGKTTQQDFEAFIKSHPKPQIMTFLSQEKQALKDNPVDIEPLKNLTMLFSILGETTKAESLTEIVAGRTLQDRGVLIASLNQFLKQKDYGNALMQLDALSRADGENLPNYIMAMSSFATTAAGSDALVTYLAAHPKWRTEVINFMSNDKKQDANNVYRLFAEFKKVGAPPTRGETQAFISRLIADKTYDKAYFVWLDQMDENELHKVSSVFDGGFELELGGRFFDWTSNPIANVQVVLVSRDAGGNDRALAVDFSSGRTPFAHLSQMLKLTPGNYTFSGESKAENLENEKGLVWRVYCLPELGPAIFTTDALFGTQPWSPFTAKLTVPAQNCGTQLLRLELNAIAVVDTQVSGRVLYDSFKIELALDQPIPQ